MRHAFLTILTFLPAFLLAQRQELNLSDQNWALTLDTAATFEDETLYLPSEVALDKLPINLPSGGWGLLQHPNVKDIHVPATVEEYLWGWNGETFGVTGNYVGISWWETTVTVPEEWKGQRVTLDVEAVRFRAEIFVNHQLVGYDLVNSTPFQLDLTDALQYGKENVLSFRITDPNGNFNWKDSQVYKWGDYRTNPTHGFGGITGEVHLTATPKTYIEDIFVKNQPTPTRVEVETSVMASTAGEKSVTYELKEWKTGKKVWSKTLTQALVLGENKFVQDISLSNAKLWSVDDPNLYMLTVKVGEDQKEQRFGFRWFEIRDVKGDQQFYLNGKRIVLRTSISWSFWPENGIMPSRELARRQVESAKAIGLNMLNFHRTIGCTRVLDYADELGLLYWEEPGGNQYPIQHFGDNDKQSRFYFGYRNEKLLRMIRRDRNHPSLIIYNLHNERGAFPQEEDYREMRMAHDADPTRLLVYNSSNGENPEGKPYARTKTHLLPYDTTFYDTGWWDQHHAGGPGVYHDALYVDTENYHRGSTNLGEIIYWGEEGAIGTPPRLQLIRDELLQSGKMHSWEAQDYLNWYDAYDRFLRDRGFQEDFPCVDSLTRKMGNVAYYYQGRLFENIRMNNVVDGYAVNGWESMKLENHSGIVDNYRHPKGDPELIARYASNPLYLAVKLNRKVLSVGSKTTCDVFIVNEKNLHGNFMLQVCLKDASGQVLVTRQQRVHVTGGSTYGELLAKGFEFEIEPEGYSTVEARLLKTEVTGKDEVFAVKLNAEGIPANGLVADTTGTLTNFLNGMGIKTTAYRDGFPQGDYLLVGAFEPTQFGSGISDILEWVYKGHTLIIVDSPERWADFLADKEVLDYRGSKVIGTSWYGGNFFNRHDPVFAGLPQGCVFNWEYQCFATYNRRRIGLRCANGKILAAAVADHKKEVYSVLSDIRAGRGRILITTLDIPACLKNIPRYDTPVDLDGMNESMNTFNVNGDNQANVVGQQLLLNLLKQK